MWVRHRVRLVAGRLHGVVARLGRCGGGAWNKTGYALVGPSCRGTFMPCRGTIPGLMTWVVHAR